MNVFWNETVFPLCSATDSCWIRRLLLLLLLFLFVIIIKALILLTLSRHHFRGLSRWRPVFLKLSTPVPRESVIGTRWSQITQSEWWTTAVRAVLFPRVINHRTVNARDQTNDARSLYLHHRCLPVDARLWQIFIYLFIVCQKSSMWQSHVSKYEAGQWD